MAQAIGCSMAPLVAMERHLWINLSGIKEKHKTFLLNALLSPSGLFGDSFQEAKQQLAAFQNFYPSQLLAPLSCCQGAASAINKLLTQTAVEGECWHPS